MFLKKSNRGRGSFVRGRGRFRSRGRGGNERRSFSNETTRNSGQKESFVRGRGRFVSRGRGGNNGRIFRNTATRNSGQTNSFVQKPPLAMQSHDNFSNVRSDTEVFSDVNIEDMTDILDNRIIRQLRDYQHFTKFTKIQNDSLLPIIERKDVFVKSATGSGKTIGFLVPLIQQLINVSKTERITRKDGMRVLIISPTRELSTQTFNVLGELVRPLPFLVPGIIIGGVAMKSEKSRLRKGIVFLVGTPGRILYHLKNTNSLNWNNLRTVVLDEADKLLDMGFESQIKEIFNIVNSSANSSLSERPREKKQKEEKVQAKAKSGMTKNQNLQTLLVSATLSQKVKELSSWCLSPDRISFVGNEMETMVIPSTLKQYYIQVTPKLRVVSLLSFLVSLFHTEWTMKSSGEQTSPKVLIFFSNCTCVTFFAKLIKSLELFENSIYCSENIPILELHGKMEQSKRSEVFKSFVSTKSGIMLTTDVLCRGIDLPHTDWVIQFDAPGQPFDYLHRIGRTSRIGSLGNSLLFLMDHEMPYLKLLTQYKFSMSELKMEQVLEYLISLYPDQSSNSSGFKLGKLLQRRIEAMISSNSSLQELSKDAIIDFLRAYSTHGKNLKFIFHTKFLNVGKICGAFGMKNTPTEIFSGNQTEKVGYRDFRKPENKFRSGFNSKPRFSRIPNPKFSKNPNPKFSKNSNPIISKSPNPKISKNSNLKISRSPNPKISKNSNVKKRRKKIGIYGFGDFGNIKDDNIPAIGMDLKESNTKKSYRRNNKRKEKRKRSDSFVGGDSEPFSKKRKL